ncbi:MAG TPA: PadR family transcriptional regulator [Gemmatimonadaceae bacterium]|nr:PadR family transcriptional regulator [Gemmatimonadaceae bacterium]
MNSVPSQRPSLRSQCRSKIGGRHEHGNGEQESADRDPDQIAHQGDTLPMTRTSSPFDSLMQRCYSIGVSNRSESKTAILQGTLDLMVLQTLQTFGELHGYAIAANLERVSAGALQLNMGTLYPALMRLEQRGLLHGVWGTTENNRKARFYALTAQGRRQLAKERKAWDRMAGIIHTLLLGNT